MPRPRTTDPDARPTITLPEHEFFYTLEQVQYLLNVEEPWLRKRVYFLGRMPGPFVRDQMQAVNISNNNESPQWRIPERELRRWLARRGYKIN